MNPGFDRPFTFDRVTRIIISICLLGGLIYLLQYFSTVLIPFFIAWIIAYMLHPVVYFWQYKVGLKHRSLGVLATLVSVLGVLTGIVTLLIPPVSREFSRLNKLVERYSQSDYTTEFLPVSWQETLRKIMELYEVDEVFSFEHLYEILTSSWPYLNKFLSGGLDVLFSLVAVFVVILYVVFILVDYELISAGVKRLIPERYKAFVVKLSKEVEIGMNTYFRGQALVALIVGVLFSIGFVIIDLPLGIILGLFIGLLNLIPYLQIIGFIPVTALALMKSIEPDEHFGMMMLGVLIVFAVVQLIQEIILVPKIMGRVTGFNPAFILLSLSLWGYLLGVVGMIIALPFSAIIISYYKRYILDDESDV